MDIFAWGLMRAEIRENWGSLPAPGHMKMSSREGILISFKEAGVKLDHTYWCGLSDHNFMQPKISSNKEGVVIQVTATDLLLELLCN